MGFSTINQSAQNNCGSTIFADNYQHKFFADDELDDEENPDLTGSEDLASEDDTTEEDCVEDWDESCDGLVFGEEEEEKAPSPGPPPCWSDKEVFECFEKHLRLHLENQSRIREPPLFIGEIKRKCIEQCATHFATVDEVTIYSKAIVPVYKALPVQRVVVLLAKWDHQGNPLQIQILETRESKEQEQKQLKKSQNDQKTSYLYCFPLYIDPYENEYTSSTVPRDVLYSSTRFVCRTFYPVETQAERESELKDIAVV